MAKEDSKISGEREIPASYSFVSLREILSRKPLPHDGMYGSFKGLEDQQYSIKRCLEDEALNS